ncbi:hypothetical protein NEOKW01_0277 [Nematocida sp. AWRm80]|nr:hypothetical protein NEOKW01_0277 [Nematocida sp. AWRm80]
MPEYVLLSVLDIMQPVLNHEQSKEVPMVVKAVVKSTTGEVSIKYIETEGEQIGVNSIIECKDSKIVNLKESRVVYRTEYKVDKELIKRLLEVNKNNSKPKQ